MAAPAGDSLDDLARRADPDRWLATRFVRDPSARADVVALYAFDAEIARAARAASNPLIGEIRLAWWRERLEDIFEGRAPAAHPVLRALAGVIERRGLSATLFEPMFQARIGALSETPLELAVAESWAKGCGGALAALAATVLDPDAPGASAAVAGEAWGWLMLDRSGAVPAQRGQPRLKEAFEAARRAARNLSPAAFPAVAHATLIRPDLRARRVGPLEKRLRLVLAVARGSL